MKVNHDGRIMKQIRRLISSRVGVVKGIYPAFTQHCDPQIFSFGTEKTDTSRFFLHRAPERGGAAGITYEHAYMASIGEAIERYCCAIYNPEELVFGSYKELSKNVLAVHPNDFALFSKKQYNQKNFPYMPFTESTRVSWVRSFSLVHKKDIYIPAQMVFLPFARRRKEVPLCPITSTGLAAGPSLEFAILTALYEIVERDAFTITWLTKLPPPKLNIEDFDGLYDFFRTHFCLNNFVCSFFELTLDIQIPTAMVILQGKIEIGDIIGVGCGTRDTMTEALEKALLEVAQFAPWIRYAYQKEPDWSCKDDFSDVNSFDDHGQLYTRRPDLVKKAFSFIKKSKNQKCYHKQKSLRQSIKLRLQRCLKEISRQGYDVILYDLSTPDIIDAGFRVVRIVVPGLIPLHGHHRYPFLGGRRIYEVPVKMGLRKSVSENDINPYPHPSA